MERHHNKRTAQYEANQDQIIYQDKLSLPVPIRKIRPQGILRPNHSSINRIYPLIFESSNGISRDALCMFKDILDISQTSFHVQTQNVIAIGVVTAEFVLRNYEQYVFAEDSDSKLNKPNTKTKDIQLVNELSLSISILEQAYGLLCSARHTFADENYVFGKICMAIYVLKKLYARKKIDFKDTSYEIREYLHNACEYLSETVLNIDSLRLDLLINDMDQIKNLINFDLVDKCKRLDTSLQSLAQYIQNDEVHKFVDTVIAKDIHFQRALQMIKTLNENGQVIPAELQSICKQIEHFIRTSLLMIHGIKVYQIGENGIIFPFLKAAETGNFVLAILAPPSRNICDVIDDIMEEANKVLKRPPLLPCTYSENEKGFLIFEGGMQNVIANHVSILRNILDEGGRELVVSAGMFIKLYYEKLYSATLVPQKTFTNADEIDKYIAKFTHVYLKNFALNIPYRPYLIGEETENEDLQTASDLAYDTDKIAIDPEKRKLSKKASKGLRDKGDDSPVDTDSDIASKRKSRCRKTTLEDVEVLPMDTKDLHELEKQNPGCTQPEKKKTIHYPGTTTSTQSDASMDIFDELE